MMVPPSILLPLVPLLWLLSHQPRIEGFSLSTLPPRTARIRGARRPWVARTADTRLNRAATAVVTPKTSTVGGDGGGGTQLQSAWTDLWFTTSASLHLATDLPAHMADVFTTHFHHTSPSLTQASAAVSISNPPTWSSNFPSIPALEEMEKEMEVAAIDSLGRDVLTFLAASVVVVPLSRVLKVWYPTNNSLSLSLCIFLRTCFNLSSHTSTLSRCTHRLHPY